MNLTDRKRIKDSLSFNRYNNKQEQKTLISLSMGQIILMAINFSIESQLDILDKGNDKINILNNR